MTKVDINSEKYWDGRFKTDWVEYGGPSQSQFFATIAITNVPEWLRKSIQKNNFSFVDWGCALGDGTEILSSYLSTKVSGVDFSQEAILTAQKKYPTINFSYENWLDTNTLSDATIYDVVFSSNTLEHFHHPFDVLNKLTNYASNLIIVMVPYMETPRIKEHFFTFRPENIPFKIDSDFYLLWSKIVPCGTINNTYWNGSQIILIYAKKNFMHEENIYMKETNNFVTDEKFQNENKELITKLNTLTNKINEINNYADKLNEIKSNLMLESHELNAQLHLKDEEINAVNSKLSESTRQIEAIIASKSWRLTAPLRSLRAKASYHSFGKPLYEIVRKIYRLLPMTIRSHIFHLRHSRHSQLKASQNYYSHKADWLKWIHPQDQVIIIPCSFEFDELVNQRPINAAKYFANKNYKVIFVAWQWHKSEKLERSNSEVLPNIYQVSLYDFIGNMEFIDCSRGSIFLLTLPADIFTDAQIKLRTKGFSIIYDIMDEWEQFYNVSQAPWYKKEAEDNCVLQADIVTAVAPSLGKKFENIRTDIQIIGNGFTKEIVGAKNSRIALSSKENTILGYFGHLTDAWFNWPLIIKTAKENPNLVFEIIGYGEPEWVQNECAKLQNIKLIGKVQPEKLYEYASRWKVGIIPFKNGALAEAVDPIKVYEYLYFGFPVVTTGIKHIERYPMTYFALDDNFKSIIDNTLTVDWDEQAVNEFLESCTWSQRFDLMLQSLSVKTIGHLYET